jgi:nucleoid-associated protein YgaU
MAGTERGVVGFSRGGTGLRVAEPVRPVGERGGARPLRTGGPVAGGPPPRRDPARPGGRAVRAELRPVRVASRRSGRGCGPVAGPAPLRLTRRGWCALTALLVAGAALAVLVLSAVLGGNGELELAGTASVVVQPGDTVWSIARDVVGHGEDVRAVVDAIERLNDLQGSAVVPGQVLDVP